MILHFENVDYSVDWVYVLIWAEDNHNVYKIYRVEN